MQRRCLILLCLLLYAASSAQAQGIIFLIRHADRASGETDSPLSEAGKARAQCLAKMLKDTDLKGIYVTQFKRTQQTAQPLADQFHLRPVVVAREDAVGLAKQIIENTNYPLLVVSHSETLPTIVKELGAGTIAQPAVTDYDDFFLVPMVAGKAQPAVRLHYCIAPTDAAAMDHTMK